MRRGERPADFPERLGRVVRNGRLAAGWTQRELAARIGCSQPAMCRLEHGAGGVSLQLAGAALDELGMIATFSGGPFIEDRRLQRDAAHARCSAFVRNRLQRAGWQVHQEVEIGTGRLRGWIDLLAFDPIERALAVIEIKTDLPDAGAAERQADWYGRRVDDAADRLEWRARSRHVVLLLLATRVNDERLAANRDLLASAFPGRAGDLAPWVADRTLEPPPRRSLAMIDPLDRHATWIRPARIDGRRIPAPYADYAAFMRATRRR